MKTFLCQLLFASNRARVASRCAIDGVLMCGSLARGRKMPVLHAHQLKAGDKLTTASARACRCARRRQRVKLGENGSLQLRKLGPSKTLFKAALGVLEGAFRFTTDVAAKNRRRDVSPTDRRNPRHRLGANRRPSVQALPDRRRVGVAGPNEKRVRAMDHRASSTCREDLAQRRMRRGALDGGAATAGEALRTEIGRARAPRAAARKWRSEPGLSAPAERGARCCSSARRGLRRESRYLRATP